jgi:hypothetical protein
MPLRPRQAFQTAPMAMIPAITVINGRWNSKLECSSAELKFRTRLTLIDE